MRKGKVQLRQEVFKTDAWKIVDWLEDDKVVEHLNEEQNIHKSIKEMIHRINMPILTHLFNQNGSFFMVTTEEKDSIGFLKLVPKRDSAEMVVAIGDRREWGKGLGTNAIFQGLKHAFFNWRVDKVVAKISFENERSKKAFKRVGFTKHKELSKEIQYVISMDEFLEIAS